MTERGVAVGNKVFGAALLRKTELSEVIAGTNAETDNPLLHGEVSTVNRFYEMPDRPSTRDLLFLSKPLHFFSYQDSRDAFAIPHDLKILEEVFGLNDGNYRRRNAYWTAYSIPELRQQEQRIRDRYARLSDQYQEAKGNNDIPLN